MFEEPKYELSLCIPTYNHGKYLPKLFDSIIKQKCDTIEVVISDNASTDDTQDIVLSYKDKLPNLNYFRWSENKGFDENALNVVEMARGRYCWIIGSDDWLEDGAIEKIITFLRHTDYTVGGITVEINTYSVDENLYETPVVDNVITVLDDAEKIYAFKNIGYRFGFISAHIFLRAYAISIINTIELQRNYYIVHQLLSWIVQKYNNWAFYNYPLVAWRSGNDTMARENGHHKRFMVDLNSYRQNISLVFGKDSRIYREFLNNQFVLCARGHLMRSRDAADEWRMIKIDAFKVLWHYPNFWKQMFVLYLIPRRLVSSARQLYKAIGSK